METGKIRMSDHIDLSEEWRIISEFTHYEVSSLGRVRRATAGKCTKVGRLRSLSKTPTGYTYVSFTGARRSVHRLVCVEFHGPPPSPKREVAHNDGNRANNVASNLRWSSHRENMKDIKIHGTGNPPRGEKQGRSKLTEGDVKDILRRKSSGEGVVSIAKSYGVVHGTIGHIINGRNWLHLEGNND